LGIHNMTQRAQRLGGHLEITSRPGAGTRITAEIPLHGHVAQPLKERETPGVKQ
jgi:signal transduction histidine kinase